MRYSLLVLLFPLLGLMMNTGCGEPHDPSHVQKLDSLIKAMEYAQLRIDSLDMEKLRGIGERFNEQKTFMETQYADTLERDEAIFLGNFFRDIKKPLARLLKGEAGMNKELKANIKYMKDLRHDVSKGLRTAAEEAAFSSQESLHAAQTLRTVEEKMRDANMVVGRWELEHEQVDALIEKFQAEASKRS